MVVSYNKKSIVTQETIMKKTFVGLPLMIASFLCLSPYNKAFANGIDVGYSEKNIVYIKSVTKIPNLVAYSMHDMKDKKGYVTSYNLKVRKEPWGETLAVMTQGDTVEIIGNDKDWLLVNCNGQEGYVHSSWISVDGYDYTVPISGFLLEDVDCYDKNGNITGKTGDEEEEVEIVADAESFWLVKSNGKEFYVLKEDLDCESSRNDTEDDLEDDDEKKKEKVETQANNNEIINDPFGNYVINVEKEFENNFPLEEVSSDDSSEEDDGSSADEDVEIATSDTDNSDEEDSEEDSEKEKEQEVAEASKDNTSAKEPAKVDSSKKETVEVAKKSSASSETKKCIRTLQSKKVSLPEGEKIYFLDVSDRPKKWKVDKGSDCIILESDGKFGMIDAGINKSDLGLNMTDRIWRYLKELGATNLEFLLISHTHGDHDGCLNALVKKGLKIKTLYIKNDGGGKYKKDVTYAKRAGASIYNVEKHKSTKFKLGEMSFKLYNTKKRNYSEKNMNTIVAVATVHGKKVCLGGDLQSPKSGTKVADEVAKEIGAVDVYKVAHHGYTTPSTGINNSEKSLSYLKPKYAVVTNTKRRLNSQKSSRPIFDRLTKYTGKGNIYYAGSGTVVLNVSESGKITFKQLKANK